MFWAPPKYKPRTVKFNPDSTTHNTFVKSFSSILVTVLGVELDSDPDSNSSCKKKLKTLEGRGAQPLEKSVSHAPYSKGKIDRLYLGCSEHPCRKLRQSTPSHQRGKRIAWGRSYQAIATTTAAVSSLVTCKIIKVPQKPAESGALHNTFLNLGILLFSFSQPAASLRVRVTDTSV